MFVSTILLVAAVIAVALSTAYTLYTIREQRREDRRFNEIMKTRIYAIATY